MSEERLQRLERRLERERRARKEAEALLEAKSKELYEANLALQKEREELEDRVLERTQDLERARAEAVEASNAKTEFLSNISHEIRTPLHAIIGLTDILLGDDLSTRHRENLERVRQSGDTLLEIINQVLDFSKLDAGFLAVESCPFDLREVLESAVEIVAPRAADKCIELSLYIHPGCPSTVRSDPTRLRQILLNLIMNATKFTEQGEVTVSSRYEEPDSLLIEVKDTGIGISQEQQEIIFEPFSQADGSTTRHYGGTGLGLSISRQLARLLGGELSVRSEGLGKGSTFLLRLPLEVVSFERTPRRDLAGLKVLCVDDNATNRQILRASCQDWGMEVTDAPSGPVALEIILEHTFDLGILDMQMPVMDGLTLARLIRKFRSPEEMPLLLLTSLGAPAESTYFDAQLTKPVKTSRLYETLVHLFDRPVKTSATRKEEPEAQRNWSALVVDDHPLNQTVLKLMLERHGLTPELASSGKLALEACQNKLYDIIFMDVQMHEMDGLETAKRIRDLESPVRPWIVAVTANVLPSVREMCYAAGMDDYLAKPVLKDDLVRAMARASQALSDRGENAFDESPLQSEVKEKLLDQLGDDANEFAVLSLESFDQNIGSEMTAMIEAMHELDMETIRSRAHRLKGTCSYLAGAELIELLGSILQEAAEGRFVYKEETVASLLRQESELRTALQTLVETGALDQ